MAFEYKDGRYYIGVWFAWNGKDTDWMGGAWKDGGADHWRVEFRWRYYEGGDRTDPEGHDDKDRKSWFSYEIRGDDANEAKVQEVMDGMAAMCKERYGNLDFVEMRSADGNANVAKLAARPWCHLRILPAETVQ